MALSAKNFVLLQAALAIVLASTPLLSGSEVTDLQARGRQFIGMDNFAAFTDSRGAESDQRVFTSPEINSQIDFTEIILSWNAQIPADSYLLFEARALYPASATKYYTLGLWSAQSKLHPRSSVPKQRDNDGNVSTDTLILQRPARRLQLRVTVAGSGVASALPLKFLGICLCNPKIAWERLPADQEAWGKLVPVLERSQMAYPNGKVLCSPATVSMLMNFWAQKLNRPELDRAVPEVADAVYDLDWKGTGNWAFNAAYAGSFPGLRAYVTRLSDVSELESWIAKGIPVGLSLDYDRLRAKGPGPNGHLVVCVGFTREGDPIINDPGTSQHVRKTFPRANLIDAWSCSRNTVYLIYPESFSIPEDRFGHWDSPKSRELARIGSLKP